MTSLKQRFSKNSDRAPHIISQTKKDNMSSVHAIMVLSWFFCNLYILELFTKLEINLFQLVQIGVSGIALGFFIPITIYRKKFTMSFYEYIILNILSAGPILCAAFIFLNVTFSSPSYVETYKITSSYRKDGNSVYLLENNTYLDKEYLRTVKHNKNYKKGGSEYLKIQFSDGLFGIRLIEAKSLH